MTPELAGEGPETARMLHELAGILTSVAGFAQLLERRPEHPRAPEFTRLVAAESERAVEVMRDLQLVRALQASVPVAQPDPVPGGEILTAVEEAERLRGEAGDMQVMCDRDLAVDLVRRCVRTGRARGHGDVVAQADEAGLMISIALGSSAETDDIRRLVAELFPDLRPVAVALRVFALWGGGAEIVERDSACALELRLASA